MKTIAAAALTLAFLSGPAFAGEAEEDMLFHWGECAVVGALYEGAAADNGDPRIIAALEAYHPLESRMAARADALANALGDDRADAVQARLMEANDGDLTRWAAAENGDDFLIATWGQTMDRCVREAGSLPAADAPET